MSLSFHFHRLRRDVSNFSLLAHRDYTGFLISMHQSGTHWLKHMLACAIALKHGLDQPRYSHANDIIGGPRDVRPPAPAPHIVSSHSIPHALLAWALPRRVLRFPPYVVLVRDIRASLVANYEKWRSQYACPFSEFLRGDTGGRRFNHDLWWSFRFCNAWGRIAERFPAETMIVRYEDLSADSPRELDRINAFWKLGLAGEEMQKAIDLSGKEEMARKADPATPGGVIVVRRDERPWPEWFEEADRRFMEQACRRYLRHSFGYDYFSWSPEVSA